MMDAVIAAISDLDYAFQALRAELAGDEAATLSTLVPNPATGYTVKETLAQLAGWADYILEALPRMRLSLDYQPSPLTPAERNQQAIAARQEMAGPAILTELGEKLEQIYHLLREMSAEDLNLRRLQRGRVFTIKSYVLDLLENRISEQVAELKHWRAGHAEE